MQFRKEYAPIGGQEQVPVLVAYEDGEAQTVQMSFDAYLQIVGTMLAAIAELEDVPGPERRSRRSIPFSALSGDGDVVNIEWARRGRRSA